MKCRLFSTVVMVAMAAVVSHAQTVVTPPAGAEPQAYYMQGDGGVLDGLTNRWIFKNVEDTVLIVKVSDEEVYVRGLAQFFDREAWLEAYIEDGELIVPTGQYVGNGYYMVGYDWNFSNICDVIFEIDEETGIFTLLSDNDLNITADADNWDGDYYVHNLVISPDVPAADALVEPRVGTSYADWKLVAYDRITGEWVEREIEVGFNRDFYYIGGMSPELPGAWSLSINDNNVLTLRSGQCQGAWSTTGQQLYVVGCDADGKPVASVQLTVGDDGFKIVEGLVAICPSPTYSAGEALHVYENLWIAPKYVETGIREHAETSLQGADDNFDLQGRRLSAAGKGLSLKVVETTDGLRRVKKVMRR